MSLRNSIKLDFNCYWTIMFRLYVYYNYWFILAYIFNLFCTLFLILLSLYFFKNSFFPSPPPLSLSFFFSYPKIFLSLIFCSFTTMCLKEFLILELTLIIESESLCLYLYEKLLITLLQISKIVQFLKFYYTFTVPSYSIPIF